VAGLCFEATDRTPGKAELQAAWVRASDEQSAADPPDEPLA
jgi:hypothetical protein